MTNSLRVESLTLEEVKKFNTVDLPTVLRNMEFNIEFPEFRRMFGMFSGDYLVAIIGASLISKGVWEGWVITCSDVKKYAKRLVREAKLFSDWALSLDDIHRLQIAVLEENRKWAESIGFQFEGIVKNYHNNKDHFMYIKVGNHGS